SHTRVAYHKPGQLLSLSARAFKRPSNWPIQVLRTSESSMPVWAMMYSGLIGGRSGAYSARRWPVLFILKYDPRCAPHSTAAAPAFVRSAENSAMASSIRLLVLNAVARLAASSAGFDSPAPHRRAATTG